MTENFEYDSWLWGKTKPEFCPLYSHMISVGACIWVYLKANSSKGALERIAGWLGITTEQALLLMAYIASLHDIGKAHPYFEFRDDATFQSWLNAGHKDWGVGKSESFRHELYGAEALKRIWGDNGLHFSSDAISLFAAIISLHHQGKNQGTTGFHIYGEDEWMVIQNDLERRMRTLFKPDEYTSEPENVDALGTLVTALLIMCDWVASSEKFGVFDGTGDEECLKWAMARAEAVLTEYGLISEKCCAFPHPENFCEMWPEIPKYGVRPVQQCCVDIGEMIAALTIIEAPMGEGKTEAALYLAGRLCEKLHKQGIYMALPTAATSNQMVGRVRKLLKRHGMGDARLLHSSAWIMDENSPDESDISVEGDDKKAAAAWLRPLRRGMLSENAVGTVDQAMAAVLQLRYGMLRLAGLEGKVLIIDEIHAYDEYMSRILERLLDWCKALEIPVILLSATLQQRQKARYLRCFGAELPDKNDYPMITQVDAKGHVECTAVAGSAVHTQYHFAAESVLGDVEATAQLALDKVKNGGCICVMLNTVKQAQKVYNALRREHKKDVMLFHARYKMKRRAEIEKRCLKLFGKGGERPEKMILVCTQVVEQSLDVDFDAMITELAPVDLLLQRAGRVHRHDLTRPAGLENAEIVVLTPSAGMPENVEYRYGACGAVYAPCVLWGTEKWLGSEHVVHVPEDMRACVEQVYNEVRYNYDECVMESAIKKQVHDEVERVAADGIIYRKPYEDEFFGELDEYRSMFEFSEREDMDMGNCFKKSADVKTRFGSDSIRIAFLPRDFSKSEDERELRKQIFEESCSISLTNKLKSVKTEAEENSKWYIDVKVKIICLREEDDGTYRFGQCIFHADEDIGIWWEQTMITEKADRYR